MARVPHLVRFDWAIKHILRQKANFDVLEGFLSEVLRFDVHIVSILESESNQEHVRDKFNRVDLLVKDVNENFMIIEIQNDDQFDFLQRILYATSKLIVQHMRSGDEYVNVKKVYSINIVYFDLGQGDDYIYRGITEFTGVHKHDSLKLSADQKLVYKIDMPQQLFPEYYLIKVPKFDDEIRDSLDEWIYFFKHEEIKGIKKAKGLDAASEKLTVLKMSPEERAKYEQYLEDLHYAASMAYTRQVRERLRFEEGERKGERRGELKMLQNLRDQGLISAEQYAQQEILLSQQSLPEEPTFDRFPSKDE